MVGNYLVVLFVQADLRACCKTLWLLKTQTPPLPACSFPRFLASHRLLLGYRRALLQAAAAPSKEWHRHTCLYLISCPALQLWFCYSYFPNSEVSYNPLPCLSNISEFYWNQYNLVQVLRSAHKESKKHAMRSPESSAAIILCEAFTEGTAFS